MTLEELIEKYERRRTEGAEHDARVPKAKVYSIVLEDLRQLDGTARPNRRMTTTEAAEVLGLARKTVQTWAAEGRFPNARKTSEQGEWRIPASDVYAKLGDRQTAAATENGVPRLWSEEEG